MNETDQATVEARYRAKVAARASGAVEVTVTPPPSTPDFAGSGNATFRAKLAARDAAAKAKAEADKAADDAARASKRAEAEAAAESAKKAADEVARLESEKTAGRPPKR